MKEQEIIKELDDIIAIADMLKDKAARLRKKLVYVHTPAPKRGKKTLTAEQEAQIILKRHKRLNIQQ